jgi:hypothetical protein
MLARTKQQYHDEVSLMCRKSPLVSIIILNYNGREFLEKCLGSVLKTDYPNFEVIFIDNASTDGSHELVETLFSADNRIIMIRNKSNLGFAGGNNVGVRMARGEYIVFLNNDTEVEQDWLSELVKVISSNPTIGAAQSKILLTEEGSINLGGFIDYVGIDSRPRNHWQKNHATSKIKEVFYASGAAMIVKKKLLNEVGLFDPTYFIYNEETDLCWRIRLSGYRIVAVPQSIVYHKCRGTMAKRPKSYSLFLHRRNHISTLIKNYEFRNLSKYLPVYFVLMLLHGIYVMLRGEMDITTSYIKATLWNVKNFQYVYSRRLEVQHYIRKIPDKQIKKHMMRPRIPWHFL